MDAVSTFWFALSVLTNVMLFLGLVHQRQANDNLRREVRNLRWEVGELMASRQQRRLFARASQRKQPKVR
jgi:hypothetical protein